MDDLNRETRQPRSTTLALALIILLGAAVRLYFLFASQWMIEADEAAVGLQALHILRGERPIFFPGQAYLGNFESYLVAGAFALFDVSPYTLKFVPFAFGLIFIFLSFQIGKEIFQNERVGFLAALVAALAPVYFVMWSMKARGGFIEALVLAQLALLWFHRWLRPPLPPSTGAGLRVGAPRWLPGLIFGLIAGYAVWTNPLVVYMLAPLGVVLCARALLNLRGWRHALVSIVTATLGGLFGLLPFILFRLANGRELFRRVEHDVPPTGAWRDLVQKVWQYFWQDGLPTLLGLRVPRQAFEPDWRLIVVPLYVLALLWLIWQARQNHSAAALALMIAFSFPLFAFGSITGGNFAVIIPDSGLLTRYLLPLYILLTQALGLLFAALLSVLRWGALAILLAINLWSVFSADAVALSRNEFSNQPLPADQSELLTFLAQAKLRYVYTSHWIGFPLMLESREQIITLDYPDIKFEMDRFPDYRAAVEAAPNPALVVFNPHYEPNPLDARLKQLQYTYAKTELQHFIVYYNFKPRLNIASIEDTFQWPYY